MSVLGMEFGDLVSNPPEENFSLPQASSLSLSSSTTNNIIITKNNRELTMCQTML